MSFHSSEVFRAADIPTYGFDNLGKSLETLEEYEKQYIEEANILKSESEALKLRAKNARKKLRQKPSDEVDNTALQQIIAEIQKTEHLIQTTSLDFLENSLKKETEYVERLEQSNTERKNKASFNQPPSPRSPRSPRRSLLSEVDALFDTKTTAISPQETDARIKQMIESISQRQSLIKEEKRNIKMLERQYEIDRLEIQDEFNEKQETLEKYRQLLNDQISLLSNISNLKKDLIENKSKLVSLEMEKEQLERQNFTVMRDKRFNNTFTKKINEMKNRIEDKKKEIDQFEESLTKKRGALQNFQKEVEDHERFVASEEQRISRLEAEVSESGRSFQGTIDQSKAEFDALSRLRFSRTNGVDSIGDEIASILSSQ